jgi:hypothetical protein
MGRVSGIARWVLTAALFAGALVLLLVAILTHNAVPLFLMWAPLLAVPLVLGRADPELRQRQAATPADSDRPEERSETIGTDQG